ncbi:hypothetical protein H1R78_00765 [Nocardia farcinica]|nr:hypothetical protein DXT66_02350 [Nocardia farcinica]MBA4854283.1 hypothetical protein [Nocardia farcinica]MBC9814468.1 hypothetical protein [Nocardia farcinica]MBF6249330.1 hypothetical protein [Nocardia farcinica]MBF6572739.1 hypothetical protein [Nocardia farcinica]
MVCAAVSVSACGELSGPAPTSTSSTTAAPATPRPAPPSPAQQPPPPPAVAPPLPAAPGPSCHPSYDPCVPITSDVDCSGGSGNGPAYTGRVRVVGPDEYDLDRDNDGIGCESG